MIRRSVGAEYWLITQHDHALLAGALARRVGNRLFAPMNEPAIVGVDLHDCGWPLHDDEPTLNGKGQPIDVFESNTPIALRVWEASADRAIERDPYAGLLVSLHVLSLSILASSATFARDAFDTAKAKTRFGFNRFQHRQIEIQETLRRKLGLPVDVPLRHGLAEGSNDPAELMLQFDFHLFQAMDQISLALCCTKPPADRLSPTPAHPGDAPITMSVRKENDTTLRVDPWPFREDRLSVSTSFRRLPGQRFADPAAFREAYAAAEIGTISFALMPR